MPKLTPEQIEEIIKLYSEGMGMIELAAKFGVSQPTISYHVNPKVREKTKRRTIEDFKKLSLEERRVIYARRKEYLKNWLKKKYNSDPEWREKMKTKSRDYQRQKEIKQEQEAKNE